MTCSRRGTWVFLTAALVLTAWLQSPAADMRVLLEADWIEEETAISNSPTRPRPPAEVTTRLDAAGGCDGVKTGRFGFHTASGEIDPWWQVDLGSPAPPRSDRGLQPHRRPAQAHGETPGARGDGLAIGRIPDRLPPRRHTLLRRPGKQAPRRRSAREERNGKDRPALRPFQAAVPSRLDEVEVYGRDNPTKNLALNRPADQKSIGPYSYPGTKGHAYTPPGPRRHRTCRLPTRRTPTPSSQRARQLARRLTENDADEKLTSLLARLEEVEQQLANLEAGGAASEADRRACHFQARQILREIAFCNPLLDFDRVLFVKTPRPGRPLPHGPPVLRLRRRTRRWPVRTLQSLFESSIGRRPPEGFHRRKRSTRGSTAPSRHVCRPRPFLRRQADPPSAYTQGLGEKPEWSPRASYHVFEVGADGTGLRQLTDSAWDDFDPLLPARRTDRLRLHAARRLSPLRRFGAALGFAHLHALLHGRRRQRRCLFEFSRDPGMASQSSTTTAC